MHSNNKWNLNDVIYFCWFKKSQFRCETKITFKERSCSAFKSHLWKKHLKMISNFFWAHSTKCNLKIKGFEILVKFWLCQSDVMLRIVMLLSSFAVMRCLPRNVAKPHISFASAFIIRRSRHHLPKANIIEKSTCNLASAFFWLPLLGSNQRHHD